MTSTIFFQRTQLFFAFFILPFFAFSQNKDTVPTLGSFYSAVSVTNNGISLLPNFSLGKPAVIFNMAVGSKRWSFEPEMRFAIEGAKPWSFIFWGRYKILKTDKFSLNVGAHPSFVFRAIDNTPESLLMTLRYAAAEVVPTYTINKNVNVGIYYLRAIGLDKTPSSTDFLALRSNIANIPLSNDFFCKITPQLYYLNISGASGTYVTSIVSLTKKNSPLSITSILSKAIKTNIAGKDFVWNVSLVYSFDKKYKSI